MLPYGSTKKRRYKIHPHNECSICSDTKISKGSERQKAKRDLLRYKPL